MDQLIPSSVSEFQLEEYVRPEVTALKSPAVQSWNRRKPEKRTSVPPVIFFFIKISFICLCTSAMLFWTLYNRLGIIWTISLPVSIGTGVIGTIFWVVSLKARCILFLCVPQMGSQQGKILLLSIVSGILLGGPMLSIMYNINQVSVTVKCVADLAANQGRIMGEAYRTAFNNTAQALEESSEIFETISDGIKGVVKPYQQAFESFSSKLDGIKGYFHIFGANPIVDLIQYVSSETKKLADLIKFDFSVDIEANNAVNMSNTGEEIVNAITNEFTEKFDFVKSLFRIVQSIFILPILLVPISSFLFLKKCMVARQNQKKTKKFHAKLAKDLRKKLIMEIALLLTHLTMTIGVCALDLILFWIESVIRQNGQATFTAEGDITLKMNVESGAITNPFSNIFVRPIYIGASHNFTFDTNACLPNPMQSSGLDIFIPIGLIYSSLVLLILVGNWGLDKRVDIVKYFYP